MKIRQGAYVKGKTCFGSPFTGVVLSVISKHLVHLTPDHITPVGLLTHVNGKKIDNDEVRK